MLRLHFRNRFVRRLACVNAFYKRGKNCVRGQAKLYAHFGEYGGCNHLHVDNSVRVIHEYFVLQPCARYHERSLARNQVALRLRVLEVNRAVCHVLGILNRADYVKTCRPTVVADKSSRAVRARYAVHGAVFAVVFNTCVLRRPNVFQGMQVRVCVAASKCKGECLCFANGIHNRQQFVRGARILGRILTIHTRVHNQAHGRGTVRERIVRIVQLEIFRIAVHQLIRNRNAFLTVCADGLCREYIVKICRDHIHVLLVGSVTQSMWRNVTRNVEVDCILVTQNHFVGNRRTLNLVVRFHYVNFVAVGCIHRFKLVNPSIDKRIAEARFVHLDVQGLFIVNHTSLSAAACRERRSRKKGCRRQTNRFLNFHLIHSLTLSFLFLIS